MRKILLLVSISIGIITPLFSQTKTIKGKVVDSLGNGIASASIVLKGTKTGTAADALGTFSISAKEGDVLVVSALNFLPKEIVISTLNDYQITLESQVNISEVVVTALGLKRNKNELPYAAQQVTSDEITKTRTNNFANSLSGKVAG